MNNNNFKFKPKLIRNNIELIKFKKLTLKHIDYGWLSWVNSLDIQNRLNSKKKKYSKKDLVKVFETWKNNKDIIYAVHMSKSNEYIGNVRLSLIDQNHSNCTFGRMIGFSNYRSKGIGTLVTYKICQVVFDQMNLNKLWTHVFTDNIASIKSNLSAGLKIEGKLIKHFKKNNIYKDVYSFGINSEKYERNKKAISK